ncbi:MAG: cobyrinate a,c-diamide synthase [Desulfotomaculaceae bacterium]|nr:cobyrinate a,c-diamide synthase [Desulfotomaculaceae bacterium]MDD4767780.1 cobyrinate a,c-diamide synthase [Desulfotomaculaceae bacterium]
MNRVIIAGTHSGAGKTTVTAGLLAALWKKGLSVQPFKVGPDYIDTGYHAVAAGRMSYNLDLWMMPARNILQLFRHGMDGMDIGVIEGVMGLYDGVGSTPESSTAEIAKLLNAPVILVVDAGGMSTSVAAQVLGYKTFDRGLRLAGVIVNNVGSERHYKLVRDAVESYTGIPVLGFLPRDRSVELPSRHLGLLPAQELERHTEIIEKTARLVREWIDLDQVIALARSARPLPQVSPFAFESGKPVQIAVARDESFSFYYRSTLELLASLGAELRYFSPRKDGRLPESIDGLYLGGGFPEVFAGDLAANGSLLEDINRKLKSGLFCYAECGGFMYLTESITAKNGEKYPMAGFFDGHTFMTDRLQRFGYVDIEFTGENVLGKVGQKARGHEFHHSLVEGITCPATYLIKSAFSGDRWQCGYRRANTLAAYAHIDFWGYPKLARHFLDLCRG